jgi:hypothetical protein
MFDGKTPHVRECINRGMQFESPSLHREIRGQGGRFPDFNVRKKMESADCLKLRRAPRITNILERKFNRLFFDSIPDSSDQ